MIGAIIQARLGSRRRPKKVLTPIGEYTLLEHVLRRLKKSQRIEKIVLSTTLLEEDSILKETATSYGVEFFQGSSENVLNRFIKTAELYDIDTIVRICADSPFLDWESIDDMLLFYEKNPCHLLTINANQTRLLDGIEVTSLETLKMIDQKTSSSRYQEHVTLALKEEPLGKINFYTPPKELQQLKPLITIDTQDDLERCQKIAEALKPLYPDYLFPAKAIVDLFKREDLFFE